MAPNKKKKKPASNPARGFATVSIPSKPKPEIEEDAGPAPNKKVAKPSKKAEVVAGPSQAPSTSQTEQKNDRKSVELSPEEYELQLEEADVQNFLDKHLEKVTKDVARQISRLQTDRRVLRGHGEPLNLKKWLPVDTTDRILELHALENESKNSEIRSIAKLRQIPEDEAVVRLWTLQEVLKGLNFQEDLVQAAIEDLVSRDVSAVEGIRDGTWALEETLDWLALRCPPEGVESYYSTRDKTMAAPDDEIDDLFPTEDAGPKNDPAVKNEGTNDEEIIDNGEPVSDLESDLELDELLAKYLQIKSQIYDIDPNSAQVSKSSKAKASKLKTNASNGLKGGTRLMKLVEKLKKIESDPLFDVIDAEQKWTSIRIEKDREASRLRKEQHLAKKDSTNNDSPVNGESQVALADQISRDAEEAAAELLAENIEENGEVGIFGDMFANIPDFETNISTGASELVTKAVNGEALKIRDFGEWTGIGPKRVFEEACKARDSGVQIKYTTLSSSAWSVRHAVSVKWSKSMTSPEAISVPDVSCKSTLKLVRVSMDTVSAPTSAQSEAYCATTALFYLFSWSKSEERIYMRLPPVWKDLYLEFVAAKKDALDSQNRQLVKELRGLIREKASQDLEDGVILVSGLRKLNASRSGRATPNNEPNDAPSTPAINPEDLKQIWAAKSSTSSFQYMLPKRAQLPMFSFKQEVLETINAHQVVIVCGETGCGKSTQLPSFILENELAQGRNCRIYCAEPRRISAISLARRVSEELGEHRQDLGSSRSLVGYAIRLEANMTKETRLVYATTGIIMRMLERSNNLEHITHLILDEVHERSIDSDFLLIVLRRLLVKRSDLKVILMSATVDAQKFSVYLNNAPVLMVPGRTFPVKTKFLEDAIELTGFTPEGKHVDTRADDDEFDYESNTPAKDTKPNVQTSLSQYSNRTRKSIAIYNEYAVNYDLILSLLRKLANDNAFSVYSKAILIFLPGIAEIRRMSDILLGDPGFMRGWCIYPLHSTISNDDQQQAFQIPPHGQRKIVLATNIAETGITIPDITCVIDTGMHKEMRFDEKRQLSRLLLSFISRANAKQRRGRAGRVQAGLCFHLFTRYRHDTVMSEQQTPELLRLSLQDLVLRVKTCNLGDIQTALSDALDAPQPKNIRRAIDSLIDVKALTATEELTPLGQQLAKLPLDVQLGKLILLGCVFGCLDMALSVSAILSSKSPFESSFNNRSQSDLARLAFKKGHSDILTVFAAYVAWRRVCQNSGESEMQYCRKHCLSHQTLCNIEDLKAQLLVCVVDAGFLSLNSAERDALSKARFQSSRKRNFVTIPDSAQINQNNEIVATSVIAWAFYPKIISRDGKGWRNISNNQHVSLHPSSVNKGNPVPQYLSYYHIMQSSNKFYNTHETTIVHPLSLAVLGGEATFNSFAGVITIDGNRLRFSVPDPKSFIAIKSMRAKLRDLCDRSYKSPGRIMPSSLLKWLELWNKICLDVQVIDQKAESNR